jgi:hypothetical protein
MPIYLAIPLRPDSGDLDAAVERLIPEVDRYKLQADRGWLFKFNGTTIEASNGISLTGQAKDEPAPIGAAMVVPVTSYYGRGPMDMWEWLKIRLEQ